MYYKCNLKRPIIVCCGAIKPLWLLWSVTLILTNAWTFIFHSVIPPLTRQLPLRLCVILGLDSIFLKPFGNALNDYHFFFLLIIHWINICIVPFNTIWKWNRTRLTLGMAETDLGTTLPTICFMLAQVIRISARFKGLLEM